MDQKLIRYFTALRDETAEAEAGGAAEISEVVNDISRLCEDLYTDEDISFALATIFDPNTGIFDIIERLLLNRTRNVQKGKESCFNFVAEFIRQTNTRSAPYAPHVKERCIYIFQRDDSKSVQSAALLPISSLIDLCVQGHGPSNFFLDWTTANILLQEYRKAKSSGTLRSNILSVLGSMVECFPSMFKEENTIAILDLCLDCLDEQLRQKGKDPSFVLVAGAMKCLDGLIMWFDRTLPAGGSVDSSRRIYTYLEQVLYFREDLKRYEMVKAGLRLLSRHACLFQLRLIEDCMSFLKWLESYCTHVNAHLRDAGLPAFNEFMFQVSIGLSSEDQRILNAQNSYKKLLAHALEILDNKNQNFKLVAIAIRMVGKLSPVIMKFSGEAVLQQAFQRVSAFGSLYRRSEAQEESLGFSVTLVEAVADIIETLGVADNYIITTITEAVGHIYFNFPNLFPKQKPTIYQTLQKLFKNLEKHGSIFSVFMNNIVWSSLERAMEPSTEENAITVELWQNYVELWSNLVDFDSATCYKKEECTSKDSIDEGRYVRIKEGIFDAMIVCGIKALQELNLKYRVKPVTTDKEIPDGVVLFVEGEGTLNPDSDINPIEPLNARDMKKFLNLVEFLQGFLSSHSVPYCPKWILPFMRSLIELSSSYPLLSGFYKLLTVMMKIADDHGYFETVASSTLMSHDTSMYCQLDTEHRQEQHVHEDSLVCGDLLQHFLQEVVVSSKRYKLELLASCLRLCLSAPPSLMDLKSKIDPLKVALKMGLRYNPLAGIAMDTLERHITFNQNQLNSLVDTIVPFFNPYLSINLAASASETETSPTGNSDNKNVLLRRAQREQKEKIQQDPFQLLQLRIQRFLGRIGKHAHSLVPDVNLLQIGGAGGLSWNTTEQLRFILPFRDDKTDMWLDSLLPRIVELAQTSSDRGTKVGASELLHAMCILMMGNAAKGPSWSQISSQPNVYYEKIYRKVFPAVVRLAADVEQVTRELFSKLVMQMIHWFTSNRQKENPDTMALLDSILDGLVDSENASLREFCANCYEEFLDWSIRHSPPQVDNYINVTSVLRRLYNRLDHPNPYHRLGAAMACSRLYPVMRKNKSIVDRYLLEMLFFCFKSLRIAEDDLEQIGTIKQLHKVIDNLQRLLKHNISILAIKRKDRLMFITLGDFLEWIFKQTLRPQDKCRSRSMDVLITICKMLQDNSSLNWLEDFKGSGALDDAINVIDANLCFSTQIKGREDVESVKDEIKSLTRSMHWCDWVLRTEIVTVIYLSGKVSSLFLSMKEFLRSLMSMSNPQIQEFLTPLEFEQYERSQCRAVLHFLSFAKELICKGLGIKDDELQPLKLNTVRDHGKEKLICKIIPVDASEFLKLLFLLILTPQDFGFRGTNFQSYELLSRLVMKLMKLLTLSSFAPKERLLECLRSLLETRPDLDAGNMNLIDERFDENATAGLSLASRSVHLENFKYLLKGYQQLLVAGILLPVLWTEKAHFVGEKLLNFVSTLNTSCSSTLEVLSSEILSIVVLLGIKVERLLEFVFNETLIPDTSVNNHTDSAGSIFYMRFRKVLVQKVKFFYRESLPLVLEKAIKNFTARLLLNALLDDYINSRTEENMITLKCFLNEFISQISRLAPCCRIEALYSDKLFFLEVLYKLLVLDSDGHILLLPTQPSFQFMLDSFLVLLGGAVNMKDKFDGNTANGNMNFVVQSSALGLVPYFASAACAHLFIDRISTALTNVVTNVLLVRETDIPSGSTHRATYLQTLDRLLAAVCSSKSPQLLEVLFPILQNCIPLAKERLLIALKQFINNIEDQRSYVCSMCLQILHDKSKIPSLKHAITEDILIPLVEVSPVDFVLAWYAQHMKDFFHAISRKPESHEHQSTEDEVDFLIFKSCIYKIISCLFMNFPAALIRDQITPLVSNQQLMQIATNDCRAKNDPTLYPFPDSVSLWRDMHVEAYNCLAAVVMCTQDQERIFTILFKDFAGKPLWQHLIDCDKIYDNFPVEISQLGSLKYVTSNLRSNRIFTKKLDGTPTLALSQYMMGATLSQEPSLVDSFVGGSLESRKADDHFDENSEDTGIANLSSAGMDLADQDDFDKHPCFRMVLKVISHLHSKFNVSDSQVMPEWMKALHSTLSNSGTPINICLFIIKVVIRARKVFAPFGSDWVCPVLQPFLNYPESSGGVKFHYILRDISIVILDWNLRSPPDKETASRFLNHLFQVAPHESNQVLRANLEIIQQFLARWKDCLVLDTGVIASHLLHGDKNPSVSDKAATMHKIVGLQILGAMISVGLDLTNDTKISQEDWIKALLSCLNSKAKGVYEASAELLGMLLGKQSGIHCEQLLETRLRQILLGLFREGEMGQFLTIVDKISLHCASFMEGYSSMIFDLLPRVHGVFRVLSLSIILRCSAALPNLFSLILPFLSKMLTHRDEVAQFKSLQLVAELVKDADKQIICEQILPILIESFSTHDTVECRKRYYEILVFLFVTRKIMTEETLTCNLLRGLCDNSYSIRENLQSFWNKQLSSNPRERFLEMISRIYSPAIEDHWVHIANSLLLKLCEEAVDYKRPIFNAPLSDCEFKEHTIDTSFLAGTFPMTPMFHDTQVAASQIQTQEQDVEHSVPSAKGPNMLRATISQTQTLEPSVGLNSFSTFSSGESESSLFALSQRKIKSLDSTQLSGSSQVKSVGISRRRLLHPSAARPQILRNVLSAMKRREARIAQQALERSNKVNVLRKYRIGELPDIEINHEEIIRPLAALSERDSTFSCLLLRVLCRAIYAISANQYLDNGLELKPSVIKAIESVFERTQNNISFVNCVLSLCLEDRESFIKPTLIGSVSMKSTNFQSGILYLENVILNSDLPWNHSGQSRKRHKNSRGHATMQPDALQQAWLELASLYRSLGENDIVLSIYKKHLTKATSTHNALEAELGGESVRALRLYDKAIDHFNGEEEDSVHPSDIEQDLWYVRRLYCLTRILNWRAVIDEILFQVEDCLDKLWEPKVRDSYLSLFVRAAIKVPTHHSKLSNFLQTSANESWKNALIMKEFSTQVTTLAVSNDEFDKARFFIHECYESFLKHWTQFHPLAANARHFQIIKLQMTTELSEFLENVTHYKFGDVLRMMLEWRNRWPSPTMDDAEAWDDVVQNRLLFFQKLQSVFNSHLQRQNEEEGIEFARWLDGERAHLYYTASKGLVKQGSFEAAKSYMNQFVALNRDKLDFASYKSIIKLRCLEADRASRTDLQKACDMLQQVLGYLEGSLQKHSQPSWQFGLKILEGCAYSQLGWLTLKMARSHLASAQSINNCLKHLGSAFVAYRNGLEEMSKEKSEISLRTIAKYSLKFAFFCDELLKSAENERCGLQFQELMHNGIQAINLPAASVYPNLIVEHVLKSVRFDYSMNAHHGIARVLAFVGKYRDTWKAFVSASEDVAAWLFIPWIPQMLSSLDKDDGENFVHILEDIARLYPQAIYFPYNVSKLDFGLIGSRRATSLESILRSPILETLVRSLEDLTFPEQRLRDGLSRLKTLLEGGFQEKARGYFQALFYDILDAESMAKENRSCGEYNLKFAREYSKLLLNAVGKEGTNLLSMNEREFVKATGAIMANLQKALKVLPSGNLSLSLFSKWMANFDSSKDIWFSRDDLGASKSFLSTIDMFGSYDNFEKPDPHSHPKVVSFDQTVVSLSSKQRPKLLKVRGSDELEYKFIVKGGEDLRLDQRIEQLFEIMNAILNRDPSCAKRKLCVRTYSVIPVSRQCGMLQYVENTRPLDEVLKDGLASILLSGGVTGKDASGEVTSKIRMKFHEWLEKRGGSQNITECYRNMYAKVQIPEMEEKMFLLTSELPWDTLRTALFKLTTSAESFIALRAQYQRSLAVISIFGYVAGVGDRHLGNILLDSKGGALIPIDFGYSFGTGVILLPVPELIPFRLTPQLTNVLLPQDGIGLLRNDMVLIMNALHNSKDIVSAVMDVFVKEPLVDWKTEALKTAGWQNNGQAGKVSASDAQTSHEQEHVALKVEYAQRKLDLWNPVEVTLGELQSSIHTGKAYVQHLEDIVRGQPDRNIRARVSSVVCESVQEQVDCLIDQATDVNLLGRMWLGWQPWI